MITVHRVTGLGADGSEVIHCDVPITEPESELERTITWVESYAWVETVEVSTRAIKNRNA